MTSTQFNSLDYTRLVIYKVFRSIQRANGVGFKPIAWFDYNEVLQQCEAVNG